MEARKRRDIDTDAVPSAVFLQARITALSTALIKRVENIFALALNPESDPLPPTLIDTSTQQLQLEVESSALVRAAEEIMVLTRAMKEIWLFGSLDTIRSEEGNGEGNDGVVATRGKLEEDVRVVEDGLRLFLERHGGLLQA